VLVTTFGTGRAMAAPTPPASSIPPPATASATIKPHTIAVTPEKVSTQNPPQALPPTGKTTPRPQHGAPAGYRDPDADLRLSPQRPQQIAPEPRVAPGSTTSTSFDGMDATLAGGMPPDVSAAPGVNDIAETANESMAIYSQTGTRQFHTTLQDWFRTAAGANIFDPHITFDPRGKRYAMVADDGSNLRLSVAQQTAGTGVWCNYTFGALDASGHFADFPQIGVDSRYIYLTWLDYESPTSNKVTDSRLIAMPRGRAESCKNASTVYVWTKVRDPGTACLLCSEDQLAFRVSPAVVYDDLDGYGWFADAYPDGGAHISVHYVDSGNILHSKQVSVPDYAKPDPAAQQGTTNVLDSGQPNFTGITKTGGEMYLAMVSKYDWGNGNVNSVVSWLQIDAQAASIGLDKSGSFGYPGLWYFYPSTSGSSTAGYMQIFDYAVSGTSIYPSNAVASVDYTGTVTSNVYDAQGTGPEAQWADPNCGSNCYRWGDFTSVTPDPVPNVNLYWGGWTAGMYATADSANPWRTRITRSTE